MRRRAILLTALVLLVAGVFAGLVFADGTETLGPASISVAAGTGIATGGVGLTDGGALSGTITVEVPAGASVEQVLLYWHGVYRPSAPPATTDLDVNATTVTGDIIGGPTFIPGPGSRVATYRADITELDMVAAGVNNLNISGSHYADLNNNGAGVIVIYDDGTGASTIAVRDGNDFVAERDSEHDGVADLQVTVPQTFLFPSATADRTADLSLFAADANGARTSTIKVTVDAVVTEFSDMLQDTDGRSWDTVDLKIDIPAGATSLTVEVIADGDNDFTGIWIAAALAVKGDALRAAIDIEKYTLIQPQGGDDVCATGGKPQLLTMEYVGGSVISNPQEGKAEIKFDILSGESPVRIIANDKDKPFDGKAKVWFDSDDVVGDVSLGENFLIDAGNNGASKLGAETRVHILDKDNDNLLQTTIFHTSCSKALFVGDVFGASQLIAFLNDDGSSGSQSESTELGEDADTPTGPEGNVGDPVVWSYVITNTGQVPLSDIMVSDDQGAIPEFISGDDNDDEILDLDETWLYRASGIVVEGQYVNIGDVIGTPPLPNTDVQDSDTSHHFGVVPPADVCETGGKPQVLTMKYVDSSTISNPQEGKAEIKFDILNGESPVRIIANDKDKPFDGKAKVWFDSDDAVGDINLFGTFEIDAGNGGASKLGADTRVHILDKDSDNLLQTVKFHTSCSKALFVGDQFGSAVLVDFILE